MTLTPLGDSAVVIGVGSDRDASTLRRVVALTDTLERDRPAGTWDIVPAFGTVTVHYDPVIAGGYERLCREIERRAVHVEVHCAPSDERVREIPVLYGGEMGVDLDEVAAKAGLSVDEVVALHTGADYVVQAIGFAPGFAYLGGLPERIHTPRRATPRTGVAAGTVGIGGAQTGVYPLMTPGGWNLIGRSPLRFFDATRNEPSLMRAGDRVKFRAIGEEEFLAWR
jgi:inhibitor of KinA